MIHTSSYYTDFAELYLANGARAGRRRPRRRSGRRAARWRTRRGLNTRVMYMQTYYDNISGIPVERGEDQREEALMGDLMAGGHALVGVPLVELTYVHCKCENR